MNNKNYDKDRLVGTMRFDFNDGAIANRWNPYLDLTKEEINEIQPKVNEIMFERYTDFDKLVEVCNGVGYNKTTLIEEETINFDIAIKLIPVKGDYNGYIFVYRKEE